MNPGRCGQGAAAELHIERRRGRPATCATVDGRRSGVAVRPRPGRGRQTPPRASVRAGRRPLVAGVRRDGAGHRGRRRGVHRRVQSAAGPRRGAPRRLARRALDHRNDLDVRTVRHADGRARARRRLPATGVPARAAALNPAAQPRPASGAGARRTARRVTCASGRAGRSFSHRIDWCRTFLDCKQHEPLDMLDRSYILSYICI